MIWIVLAIIVAAIIIATAIRKQGEPSHYPIQDPNDPNYKLAYKIIDDYLDRFAEFTIQAQLTQLWADKYKNSHGPKERHANEKHAQDSKDALNRIVNDFWNDHGGYSKLFDPDIIPKAAWPQELIDKYNIQLNNFKEMNNSMNN